MNGITQLHEEAIMTMTGLVHQERKTVTQAAKIVYGRVGNYYDQTTPEERARVFCRPQQGVVVRRISTVVRAEVAERFIQHCKAQQKKPARVLAGLIMKELTLTA